MKVAVIVSMVVTWAFAQVPNINDGRYYPSDDGQYRPDNSGQYYGGDDGSYRPDNSGAYNPDDSGTYRGTADKYVHQGGSGGSGGGGFGIGGRGPGGGVIVAVQPVRTTVVTGSGGTVVTGTGSRVSSGGGVVVTGNRVSSGFGTAVTGSRVSSGVSSGFGTAVTGNRVGSGVSSGIGTAVTGNSISSGFGTAVTGNRFSSGVSSGSSGFSTGSSGSNYGSTGSSYGGTGSSGSNYGSGTYDNRNYAIIRKEQQVAEDGYHYVYETENKILGEEQGRLANVGTDDEAMQATGYFEYTGPDNVVYRVDYVANENGFVPTAAHLPTPPPIPEAILRSLEYQRSLGEL